MLPTKPFRPSNACPKEHFHSSNVYLSNTARPNKIDSSKPICLSNFVQVSLFA